MITGFRNMSPMSLRTAPILFASGVGVGSLSTAVLVLHDAPHPLWALCVLGVAVATTLVCRTKSREARSIARSLRSLSAVHLGGAMYSGDHATAILIVRCQRYPTQIAVEQLCRSTTGRWFSFYCYLPLGGGAPTGHRVEPRTPDFARGCLLPHEALYQRYFGLTSARPPRSHM